MVGPFAEAVRATTQPCTFLLLVPALAAVIGTRCRWRSLIAALGAAIVGGWVFIANRVALDGWWLPISGLVVALLLGAVIASSTAGRPAWAADSRFQTGVVAIVTFVATLWWRPCVGTELGAILTGARRDLAGELPGMAAYMTGAMLPVAAVVFAAQTFRPNERVTSIGAPIAAAVGVVVGVAMLLGRHEDVVVALTRWTTT